MKLPFHPMNRFCFALLLGTTLGAALAIAPVRAAAPASGKMMHKFTHVTLSPDGTVLADLEGDESQKQGERMVEHVVVRALPGGTSVTVSVPDCTACDVGSPAWSADGKKLAFVAREHGAKTYRIIEVDAAGAGPHVLLTFDGSLQGLHYGPDGTLAALVIAGAHRDPGALQAGAPQTGEIDAVQDEQRIATIEDGKVVWQSPADLYVYEYDWRAGTSAPAFVGTAAPGNGDENWWRARLMGFSGGKGSVLYTPPIDEQIGALRVAPDGKSVAFIGGLMSDFGYFGGDAYRLALDSQGTTPIDLTPGLPATVTSLSWCGPTLTAAGLEGAETVLWTLGDVAPHPLARSAALLSTGEGTPSLSCGGGQMAVVTQSFTQAPELAVGKIGHWTALTHDNDDMPVNVHARSVTWKSDDFTVQGWLLSPVKRKQGVARQGKVPMIVSVHGGPAGAVTQQYFKSRGLQKALLDAGYDIFMPNPRGSFGQGEAFTRANRKDFGHGDLRDILRGVDTVEAAAPVDDARLGITGYSYGGYMTMWAVTQTNRFKAAAAGGGVANWQSYYGQNGIDGWMPPFFGATVYDDPAVYAKSSPINFIKQAKTPTFIYVGANDVECPPAQSIEFYHALKTLAVQTKLVIYPGEGHGLRDPKHAQDAATRVVNWFNQYLTVTADPAPAP